MRYPGVLSVVFLGALVSCGRGNEQAALGAQRTLEGRWSLQIERSRVGLGADAIPKPEICEIAIDGPTVTVKRSPILVDRAGGKVELGEPNVDTYFADGRGDPGPPASASKWLTPNTSLRTTHVPRDGLEQTDTWELSADGGDLVLSMRVKDRWDDWTFKKVYKRSPPPR